MPLGYVVACVCVVRALAAISCLEAVGQSAVGQPGRDVFVRLRGLFFSISGVQPVQLHVCLAAVGRRAGGCQTSVFAFDAASAQAVFVGPDIFGPSCLGEGSLGEG